MSAPRQTEASRDEEPPRVFRARPTHSELGRTTGRATRRKQERRDLVVRLQVSVGKHCC